MFNKDNKMKQSKLRLLFISELIIHAVLWLSYLWLILHNQVLLISVESEMLDVNDTKLTSSLSLLSFYWFYCFVIPRYFNRSLLYFLLASAISILIFTEINSIVITLASEKNADHIQGVFFWISMGTQCFWAVCALLIQQVFANLKHKVISREQEVQHTKTELAFLKQQIHPHFLFNVLNSLYSSSYKYGDKKTSEGIGQLADLLRYMLYETQSEKVPIKKELTYLKSYIDLQMLRFSEDVTLEYIDKGSGYNIDVAPMLFITLIENAFKHGITPEKNNTIQIIINYDEQEVTCTVVNPITPSVQQKDKIGGMGLVNLRRRLMLLYPDHHEFNTDATNNTFTAKLILR